MTLAEPTFLGIGAMKCGTTTIYDYLRRHPEVFIVHGKEVEWFSFYSKTMTKDQYEDLFPASYSVRGEFSPNYQMFIPQIANVYPEMKLIFSVRDPVKKFISTARHAVTYLKDFPFDVDKMLLDQTVMITSGFYKTAIQKVLSYAGFKLLVINFDDLVNNQQRSWDELCAFLEVSRLEVTKPIHANSSDRQLWPHEMVELTEDQIARLQTYYRSSNDFLRDHYGITFGGL